MIDTILMVYLKYVFRNYTIIGNLLRGNVPPTEIPVTNLTINSCQYALIYNNDII